MRSTSSSSATARRYTLIDTAGLRRRGKVFEAVEKFSVVKTLQAIDDANVVILVLDARQDISDQDAHIAGFILEAGRALVVAVNKWDGLRRGRSASRSSATLERKLEFLGFARLHFISALEGAGHRRADANRWTRPTRRPWRSCPRRGSRARCRQAVEQQAPPRAGLIRPKLRYAHQGGHEPAGHRDPRQRARRRCRTATGATWNVFSARLSNCRARRCGSSSAPGRILMPERDWSARRSPELRRVVVRNSACELSD